MRERQKYIVNSVILLSILFSIIACNGSSGSKISQEERAKLDSLFFGIKFGQADTQFMDICRELNNQGVLGAGHRGTYVMYRIESEQDSTGDIRMHFYPGFDDQRKINEMDMEFSFFAWAPWNKQYQSDVLNPQVRELLETWYPGNAFTENQETRKWVKQDHTRIIEVSEKDSEVVKVKIYKSEK